MKRLRKTLGLMLLWPWLKPEVEQCTRETRLPSFANVVERQRHPEYWQGKRDLLMLLLDDKR